MTPLASLPAQAGNGTALSNPDFERTVLGCALLNPDALFKITPLLSADDFSLDSHRRIFHPILELANAGKGVDDLTVVDALTAAGQLEAVGGMAYVSGLTDLLTGEMARVTNVEQYSAVILDKSSRRKMRAAAVALQASAEDARTSTDDCARQIQESLLAIEADSGKRSQNWRGIFHTNQEFEDAPPLRFVIDGFLQEAGVTLIGGLAGHGKTLLMLAMAKALLEELPLFGYEPFSVRHPAQRVLYLIPESSLGPFRSRIQLCQLPEHIRSDRLLVRTLSSREQVSLDDPRLLKAAEGADVFLDTAVRFMDGSENDVEKTRPFADTLFRLLNAGARSITGAHHAPKGFEGQDHMTLENILRGSGDIGAMLCTAWGVRQTDAGLNQLYIQNVKPRDFQPCEPFILEGRPHLDTTGQFKMLRAPGEAGELSEHLPRRHKGGRPATDGKDEKLPQVVELRGQGKGLREIAKTVGVGKSTVERWLFGHDASQKCPTVGQFRDKAEPDGETET